MPTRCVQASAQTGISRSFQPHGRYPSYPSFASATTRARRRGRAAVLAQAPAPQPSLVWIQWAATYWLALSPQPQNALVAQTATPQYHRPRPQLASRGQVPPLSWPAPALELALELELALALALALELALELALALALELRAELRREAAPGLL